MEKHGEDGETRDGGSVLAVSSWRGKMWRCSASCGRAVPTRLSAPRPFVLRSEGDPKIQFTPKRWMRRNKVRILSLLMEHPLRDKQNPEEEGGTVLVSQRS